MATDGHHEAAMILSKDVARNRAMRKQYLIMGSQLKSVELQLQSMQMNQAVMKSLAGSTTVMAKINEDMKASEMKDVLKEFQKEVMKAGMNLDIMEDSMAMIEDPDVVANADGVYENILDEMALVYVKDQPAIPKDEIHVKKDEVDVEVDDMESRLAALRQPN